jgi:hypothetical protein
VYVRGLLRSQARLIALLSLELEANGATPLSLQPVFELRNALAEFVVVTLQADDLPVTLPPPRPAHRRASR